MGPVPARTRRPVSLLDRLVHHNNVIATEGESYRMREARAKTGGRPTKP
jgi:DNA replication protein DnaC